jgi:thioredoxin reductase (NADPH)
VRQVSQEEVLFREGDASYDFFVVESGAVAIVQGYGSENRVIVVHGAHRFLGELSLLTGSTVYLTAVVRDPGEVIQVPARRLISLVAEDPELANIILRAYLSRREQLIEEEAGVRIVGSRYSRDARRLREFVARNRMPTTGWISRTTWRPRSSYGYSRSSPPRHPSWSARAASCATLRTPSLERCSVLAHVERRRACATW